ncbi:MAG: hypothetical protein ABL986_04450 [Vicinamibacterales bacterium]
MATANDRDPVMDKLLARALARGESGDSSCVDAEALAAWTERTLPAAMMTRVENHVSGCARCQAVVAALVRSEPEAAPVESLWKRWHIGWLVPVAGTAAAIAIYVATRPPAPQAPELVQSSVEVAAPQEEFRVAPEAQRFEVRVDPPAPATPPADSPARERLDARAEADAAAKAAPPAAATAESAELQFNNVLVAPPAAAAPVAAPASPAPPRAAGIAARAVAGPAPLDVRSPSGAERWRLAGSGIPEYSTDGGATWQPTQGVPANAVRAGASPAAGIGWFVGGGGAVWLTEDGVRFMRLRFPETVDLTGVTATSARSAIATAADGRRFSTSDRGSSWTTFP